MNFPPSITGKKMLFTVNIIGSPILTILLYSLTTFLVPKFVFEGDLWFLEDPLRVGYVSMIISVLALVILVLKRERMKTILLYTILPFILSVIFAPITLPIVTTIMIFFVCSFRVCLL